MPLIAKIPECHLAPTICDCKIANISVTVIVKTSVFKLRTEPFFPSDFFKFLHTQLIFCSSLAGEKTQACLRSSNMIMRYSTPCRNDFDFFSRILILTLYIDNLCKMFCPSAVGNYASVISWIFDLCIG